MRKNTKKLVAVTMAASMALSSVGLQAFAAENPSTETVQDGGLTTVITTTTATDSNATPVKVTVTVEKDTTGTDAEGNKVEREETSTEVTTTEDGVTTVVKTETSNSTITSPDGTVTTKTESSEEGTETKTTDAEVKDVTVTIPGDEIKEDAQFKGESETGEPIVVGDKQNGENDDAYNYTVTEEIPREVTVTTGDVNISYDNEVDQYEGEQNLQFMTPIWNGNQKNLGGGTLDWFPGNPLDKTTEGYDFTPYGFMHNDVTHMWYIRTDKDGGMVDVDGNAVYYYDAATNTYTRNLPDEVEIYDIGNEKIKPLYYKTTSESGEETFVLIEGNDASGNPQIENVVFVANSMMVAFYDKSQTHSEETWAAVYDDLMALGTSPTKEAAAAFNEKHPGFLDIIDISKLVEDYQDGVVSEETTQLYNTIFALIENEKAIKKFEAPANMIPAYCVDVNTGTVRGYWYDLMNIEDAGYYSTERNEENGYVSDADRIKAIALHGYWGTAEGEQGSLTEMKRFLKARLDEATAKGEDLGFTQADIDFLTHGEALTITQHSIWRFGNSLDGAYMDGHTYAYGNEAARDVVIDKFIAYFTTMPIDTNEFDESEIMTQEKFIGEMKFVVGDKAEGHANNLDDDDKNDAYESELSFSLVVTPGEGDDLVVSIVSGDKVIAKARIAGDGSNDDETFTNNIISDGNGNYTFKGLTLIENSNQTFSLNLEGAQYLEQGVYLFKAAGGAENSQTFATIASGTKAVDLQMEIDLTFNVEEGSVVETRKWKKTERDEHTDKPRDPSSNDPNPKDPSSKDPNPKDPRNTPPQGTNPGGDDDQDFGVLGAYDEVMIDDDMIPLGVLPATGDRSPLWMLLSLISGFGLAISTFGKRKKNKR